MIVIKGHQKLTMSLEEGKNIVKAPLVKPVELYSSIAGKVQNITQRVKTSVGKIS